jgi:periplasmic divalent cation tolerance protein
MPGIVLVYTTWPDAVEAEQAGTALVGAGLAACVNILPGMISVYRWQGRVERGQEVVMIVKTLEDRADAVRAAVLARHPYDVPAILVIPVTDAHESWARWLAESVAVTD